MWEYIGIIGVVVGIIGGGLGIFIGLKSKQVFRPVLTFNVGLLYADQNAMPRKKLIKKADISALIYGANIPQNSEVAFLCPYLMINNSKLPIYNITLQLQYASKYIIKNEEKIIGTIDKGMKHEVHFLSISSKWHKHREVQKFDSISMVQIRYTITVLRPGEKIVILDPMKFTKFNRYEELGNGDYIVSRGLSKKLREIEKLCDFCVADVFVYSESCPPLSKRIKLLWFDTNSQDELVSLANDATKAFWGGKWPKPGIYFSWPLSKDLIVKEYGEVIIPKLEVAEVSEDRYFYWENPLESESAIAIFVMPSWNYYQLSGNLDTDDLIMRSGFLRAREYMEKLRNIFKGLRKR